MILHKPTNRIFKDRAEAKRELGANRYKNAVQYQEIIFMDNVIATYELQKDYGEGSR